MGVKFKYELFTRWSKSGTDWTRIITNNMPVDFTDNFSSPQRRNGDWSSLQEAQITHIWKRVLPIHDCSTQDVKADENLHVYTCTHNVKL